MAAFLHRKPAFARTSHDSCSAHNCSETNKPYEYCDFACWVLTGVRFGPSHSGQNVHREFQNLIPRKIFESKRDEEVIDWRKLHTAELRNFYSLQNFIRIKLRREMDVV